MKSKRTKMKNIALLFFIVGGIIGITLSACGQKKTEIKDIDNVKTDQHINIPGTRLFIVPPPDFKIATSFVGLQKDDNALGQLQVYDYVGTNYYTNTETFDKGYFENIGLKFFEYKEFKVNDFPAKYVFGAQNDSNNNEISLFFGDSTFLSLIMVLYPSSDTQTGEEIQKSINTIFYDKNFKVDDPLAAAPFTLDESKSVFKFTKVKGGMFMYYIDGKEIESNNDEPRIIVVTLPNTNRSPKNVSEDLLSDLREDMLTDEKLKNISTANVNGLPAYEVEIYGKLEGENSLIYQLIVYSTDKIIAIQGMAKSDLDNNLKEFKNLARTIKLK